MKGSEKKGEDGAAHGPMLSRANSLRPEPSEAIKKKPALIPAKSP